jgi:SM-20-related protein
MFRIAATHDATKLADEFAHQGWVQIADFLAGDSALELHRLLRGRNDWKQILTMTKGAAELDRPTRTSMTADQHRALDDAVYAAARDGFQYRYESLRVPDTEVERAAQGDQLADFAEWMSQGEARNFLRTVTGAAEIDFVDAQGTAYSPGDFLTGHDDDISEKHRHAAYVFGLTPVWRLEWGGLLLFHGADGNVSHGLTPRFNTLNLFAVPTMHSVSEVTRAAAFRRYAITGWLRSGERH